VAGSGTGSNLGMGTCITSGFGSGIISGALAGSVQILFTKVCEDVQVGITTTGSVQILFTKVCEAVQVGTTTTGSVQTLFTRVCKAVQVGTTMMGAGSTTRLQTPPYQNKLTPVQSTFVVHKFKFVLEQTGTISGAGTISSAETEKLKTPKNKITIKI
jgi:Flp pilus assembly pilin Flp